MTAYAPIVLSTRMSDYGYWVVDVSVAPDKTVSVMIAVTGITAAQASELALTRLPPSGERIPL